MSRRETLQERMIQRDRKGMEKGTRYYTKQEHVRAELQRLARQVQKIKYVKDSPYLPLYVKKSDVLALLKEATR